MNNDYTMLVKDFNENAYKKHGFGAQRRYPNGELCRFMGRNFFNQDLTALQKKQVVALVVIYGCWLEKVLMFMGLT